MTIEPMEPAMPIDGTGLEPATTPVATDPVDDQVAGDAHHPGARLGVVTPEPGPGVPCAAEGVAAQVLGQGVIPDRRPQVAKHHHCVPVIQRVEAGRQVDCL